MSIFHPRWPERYKCLFFSALRPYGITISPDRQQSKWFPGPTDDTLLINIPNERTGDPIYESNKWDGCTNA